ncbi:MAG: ATP-binding cassette domain-containing protein [Brevinematales bacterium]|nr:ATP-binding cassette domain-containing protein [Brevinematales bacterium]
MIKLENIKKIFNQNTPDETVALSNINLNINEGDFISIIVSNGAGKTTLFNIISGNIFPTSGEIYLNQKRITKEPEYKRAIYIGRIFQNPTIGTAANMTIEENLTLAYKKGLRGIKISLNTKLRKELKEKLRLLNLGLENRMSDLVSLLSGGQRQALSLLMAVLSKPSLLLLDEHTAALDPKNAGVVLNLTEKFVHEYKLTTLMITHNMSHAIHYGNRLIMMDRGEIIFDISDEKKKNLTVEKLIDNFHKIRHTELDSDKILLE